MKRAIRLKLSRDEAESLMNRAHAGIADALDSQEDDQLREADVVDALLYRLGQAMREAGWAEEPRP